VALALAARKATDDVELHGAAVHRSPTRTVAIYALLLTLVAWFSGRWPMLTSLVFVVTAVSAALDLDGGIGPVRRLVGRDPGQTLLAWFRREAPTTRATVLVLLPADLRPARPRLGARSLLPLLVLGGLVAIGLPLRWLLPEAAGPLLGWTGLGCLVAAGVAALLDQAQRRDGGVGAERAVMGLLRRLHERPPQSFDVAVACVDDGLDHFDGTETLLLNHRRRLDTTSTRVVAWQPRPRSLAALTREGRLRRRDADPLLVSAASSLGLPDARGVSAAARARALGWRALGLIGGVDAVDQVVERLVDLIHRLDSPEMDA